MSKKLIYKNEKSKELREQLATLIGSFKNDDELFYYPWPGLDIKYLKGGGLGFKSKEFHISSNTQFSEYYNKFNETLILPKIGQNYFDKYIKPLFLNANESNEKERIAFKTALSAFITSDGVMYNFLATEKNNKGQGVLNQLNQIIVNDNVDINLFNDTKKILGKFKLKESTDYGNRIENEIISYLENEDKKSLEQQPIETQKFVKLMIENSLIVVDYKLPIEQIGGYFKSEIDFLVYNTELKKFIILDLKTSSSTELNLDYWRQVMIYTTLFISWTAKKESPTILCDLPAIVYISNKDKYNNAELRYISDDLSEKQYTKLISIVVKALSTKKEYIELINETSQ